MELLFRKAPGGVVIRRFYGLDGHVQVPEEVEGAPVTALDAYTFSGVVRTREPVPLSLKGEEAICADRVVEVSLPKSVKHVGRYAFYNCEKLEGLSFYSTLTDWGAGVFAGCSGIRHLEIRMVPGERSRLREVVSEIPRTITVDLIGADGAVYARLILPECYEESVENTPARIIMREMHGCGHMYRYCFEGSTFDFNKYDALFEHVKVQEKPVLVALLALYRIFWPEGLLPQARAVYWDYINGHAAAACTCLVSSGEFALLARLAASRELTGAALDEMVSVAAGLRGAQANAVLLDEAHRRLAGRDKPQRKRTFSLM